MSLKYFIDSIVSMSSPVVMVPGQCSVQCGHIVSCVTVTPDTCPGPGVSGQCPHVVTHSANITRNIYSILSTHELSSCSVWSQDSRHGNCFPSSSDFNSKMVSIYQFDWHLKSDEGRGIQTVIQSGPQASKFSPGVSNLSFLQPSMSFLEEQQELWETRSTRPIDAKLWKNLCL